MGRGYITPAGKSVGHSCPTGPECRARMPDRLEDLSCRGNMLELSESQTTAACARPQLGHSRSMGRSSDMRFAPRPFPECPAPTCPARTDPHGPAVAAITIPDGSGTAWPPARTHTGRPLRRGAKRSGPSGRPRRRTPTRRRRGSPGRSGIPAGRDKSGRSARGRTDTGSRRTHTKKTPKRTGKRRPGGGKVPVLLALVLLALSF